MLHDDNNMSRHYCLFQKNRITELLQRCAKNITRVTFAVKGHLRPFLLNKRLFVPCLIVSMGNILVLIDGKYPIFSLLAACQ